ncbi:response regulator transcription factor [Oscillatoria sp. FACHB-1407]|uniref:response regulator n=1 Tax=Oscillatoria sp. FACHB-1407 TaxID=2692847 RepID=UPI0016828045|nr:response regulator transcription factor [Oscillatoria sp. FACHB-1407]MBD2466011.1 response regulator transcription factor [Oscillatoria sp. FACHB-1407]
MTSNPESTNETTIRVLIADDHAILRKGLVAILDRTQTMQVVAEASNGREVIDLFHQYQPDITLMDLRMPEVDGVEAIIRIRQTCPTARIIVLTTYDGDEDIYRGLRAGAKSYLLKDAPYEELLGTIHSVHAGQPSLSKMVADKLAQRLDQEELSPRELQVLQRIAQGDANKDIAGTLCITEGTVKAHINAILRKLGASDRTQAVMIAIKRGIIHPV